MTMTSVPEKRKVENNGRYAPVNGLSMYYEVEGAGKPLVYIPMGFGVAGTTRLPDHLRLTRAGAHGGH